MSVKKVVIIGGGITGSVLALDLKQRGIRPILVEISPSWDALGHGITIQGNLLRAFQRVGVAQAIIDGGFPYDGFATRAPDGTLLDSVDSVPLGGPDLPPSVGALRSFVQSVLSRAVVAAGIEVRLGTTVTSITDVDDGVEAVLSDGTVERADVLVGADGVRSCVRPMLGIQATPAPVGMAIWRVVADRPDDLDRTNLFFGGPRYVAGLCPISSDQLYGYVVDEDVRRSRSEGPAFHEVLRERMTGYCSWWEAIRSGVGPGSSIDYRSLELMLVDDPWFRGRSIVIGDAAHVCPPMLAQGAAMGAEDAVVLAECLDLEVDVPEMFSRFMARRLPRVRKVVDLSMEVARRELHGATAASEIEENVERTMAEAMLMLCEAP